MRICNKCGESKPLEEYYKQPGGRHGRRAICKPCTSDHLKSVRTYKQEPEPGYTHYLKKAGMYEYYQKSLKYQI